MATTPVSTSASLPRREIDRKTPAAGDIEEVHEVAGSIGHSSYSQRRASCRRRASPAWCRGSRKKDVKMKVYPDKSNRIHNATNFGAPADLRGALLHGQDGHGTVRATGILPVPQYGRDGHKTNGAAGITGKLIAKVVPRASRPHPCMAKMAMAQSMGNTRHQREEGASESNDRRSYRDRCQSRIANHKSTIENRKLAITQ